MNVVTKLSLGLMFSALGCAGSAPPSDSSSESAALGASQPAPTTNWCGLHADNMCNALKPADVLMVMLNRPNQEMCAFDVVSDVSYDRPQADLLIDALNVSVDGESFEAAPQVVRGRGGLVVRYEVTKGENYYSAFISLTAKKGGPVADAFVDALGSKASVVVLVGVPCAA
jgi:hypothetical protein